MPQNAGLIMACEHVDILTAEVTYTWNNDDKQCKSSTVINTDGVMGTPEEDIVNKEFCCLAGTEAMPQDANLMMACAVYTTQVEYIWDNDNTMCKQSATVIIDGNSATQVREDANAASCCLAGS